MLFPYHDPVKLFIALSSSNIAFFPINFDISANPLIFLAELLFPYNGCYNYPECPYLPHPLIPAL